ENVGVAVPVRRPYTAPERIAGGAWDRRADVFSLAALIHELLWAKRITGTGDHIADTLTAIPGTDYAALKRVFTRALAERPAARFETALEFVDALKTAFPDVTIKEPVGRKKVGRRATEVEPQLPLDEPEREIPRAPVAAAAALPEPVAATVDASE